MSSLLEFADPHSYLGAHPAERGVVVRAFRPDAKSVRVLPMDVELERLDDTGLFEGVIEGATMPLDYELEVRYPDGGTFTLRDPYSFLPTLGETDLWLAAEGRHEELHDKLGAHVRELEGVTGVAFAVWAPSARGVSLVGDFNSWDGRLNPMRVLGSSGIWELFVPDLQETTHYKFEVRGADGVVRLKADPIAFRTEVPSKNASIVFRSRYEWNDSDWQEALRPSEPHAAPSTTRKTTHARRALWRDKTSSLLPEDEEWSGG